MLYSCSKFCLLVFETKEAASLAALAACSVQPSITAAYWSKHLNCKIWFIEQNQLFLFVEEQEEPGFFYWKISANNFVGWIRKENWLEVKELNNVVPLSKLLPFGF